MYVDMREALDTFCTEYSGRGPSGVCMETAKPLKQGIVAAPDCTQSVDGAARFSLNRLVQRNQRVPSWATAAARVRSSDLQTFQVLVEFDNPGCWKALRCALSWMSKTSFFLIDTAQW